MSNLPVIEYAATALAHAGCTITELPYRDGNGIEKINLIATPREQPYQQREVELAFVCHTDTVPYPADWQDALEPKQVDGNLHGCGACDVKAFLACLLTAAERQQTIGSSVCIVLTADEEIGCFGSKQLLRDGRLLPKRMVIGEPTCLHPARAGKGYCLAQVQFRGREAHSAHPQQGASAIYAAAHALAAVEQLQSELEHQRHSFFSPAFTTLNVGTIAGGTAKNIVPASAEFLLEWRPVPGQAAQRVPDAMRAELSEIAAKSPGVQTEFTQLREQRGFETPADAPLVRRLERLAHRPATSIAFGSEASLWSEVCDEIVVFGPGDMQTAHSRRECVPIAELQIAVEVVQSMLQQSS